MPKRTHWNTGKVVRISAILISLMTLGALIYQTNIMREEQELNYRLVYRSVHDERWELTGNSVYPVKLEEEQPYSR